MLWGFLCVQIFLHKVGRVGLTFLFLYQAYARYTVCHSTGSYTWNDVF
jgi:hypothetical protein